MAIITISRGTLSGGEALADSLAARLNCKKISREAIIEASAKRYGVAEQVLREGLESPPGFWARLTHQRERFVLAIQATLADIIGDGSAIYHGYAGPMLLADLPGVLKLRLIAPKEHRIRSAMVELGVSREEAVHHIDAVDEARAKWVHHLYHVEWTDPSLYDMVLNVEKMSMESATELVVDLVGRKEYRLTPKVIQQQRDFSLTCRVRAELVFRSGFSDDAVEVKAHHGVVLVSGGGWFDKHKADVVDFVRAIEGVEGVRAEGEAEVSASHEAKLAVPHETAADVMLPIDSYPVIPHGASIAEAIAAVSTSSVKLRDDHVIRPRFLLVTDEMHRLVGVIARRNLLRGLLPEHRFLEKTKEKLEKMAITVDVDVAFPETFRWISLFSRQAVTFAKEPVCSIMAPIRCTVKPDDDLSVVITSMLYNAVDLVPVMDGSKAVGVILMTDVFDTVAEFIMEAGKTLAADE